MKKSSIFFCFLVFYSFLVNAQLEALSKVDVSGFPSLKFDINNRNPEFKGLESYRFTQLINAKKSPVDSMSLIQISDSLDFSNSNKCVLILIEAINHPDRYEQMNTFIFALRKILPSIVNNGDKIKIAGFNLRHNGKPILIPLHDEFTDDINVLKRAISSFDISKIRRSKSVSEIPGAIKESIDMLLDVPVDFNKSILLLSEERKNNINSTISIDNVVKTARKKEIVINTIKYNRSDYVQHTIPILADQTYGERRVLKLSPGKLKYSNKSKQIEAEKDILNILDNVVRRSKGTNAAVSLYVSNIYKDGLEHSVLMEELNASHQTKLIFNSPGNWYYAQFEKNFYVTLFLSLIIGGIIFFLLNLFSIKQKEQKAKQSKDLKKQELTQLNQEAEIFKQKNEIEKIKKIEQDRINQLKEDQNIKNQKEVEVLLIQKMKELGNFPILKFTDLNSSKSFEIVKPYITVGRDLDSNDFSINNPNISRTHFSISFNDISYNISDNNSTNGMIINGYKLKESVLKNGDIIEIADCTFTFYI